MVKAKALSPAATEEADERVRLGVLEEETATFSAILPFRGEITLIVKSLDEAGRSRVSPDGLASKTLGATTVEPEVIVSAKLLLGQLAGSPLPVSTTLPPLRDRVAGVAAEAASDTLS